jgi:hypothetical protein
VTGREKGRRFNTNNPNEAQRLRIIHIGHFVSGWQSASKAAVHIHGAELSCGVNINIFARIFGKYLALPTPGTCRTQPDNTVANYQE